MTNISTEELKAAIAELKRAAKIKPVSKIQTDALQVSSKASTITQNVPYCPGHSIHTMFLESVQKFPLRTIEEHLVHEARKAPFVNPTILIRTVTESFNNANSIPAITNP